MARNMATRRNSQGIRQLLESDPPPNSIRIKRESETTNFSSITISECSSITRSVTSSSARNSFLLSALGGLNDFSGSLSIQDSLNLDKTKSVPKIKDENDHSWIFSSAITSKTFNMSSSLSSQDSLSSEKTEQMPKKIDTTESDADIRRLLLLIDETSIVDSLELEGMKSVPKIPQPVFRRLGGRMRSGKRRGY